MYFIVIDAKKCKVCGECAKVCPSEIYRIEENQLIVGNTADCSGCQSCVSVCENQAITISEV